MAAPVRLQLALQGGGAKIIHLIAALEAIESLRGQVEITRIAGTSAGAIAGALFAAGIPMSTVKSELRAFGRDLTEFPNPSKFDFVTTVMVRGQALARTTTLSTFLTRLFGDVDVNHVGDIPVRRKGPPVRIVHADLYSGVPQVARDNENIVTALLDSCAIPFYFRVWRHPRGGIVDGGLCENLAVAELREDQEEFGPIVALSLRSVAHRRSAELF